MPHPDTWFLDWLKARNLVAADDLRAVYVRLEEERKNAPLLGPLPTLGGLLEREGRLTREQREAGEREAAARAGAFMAWRSQTLREQDERRLPPS